MPMASRKYFYRLLWLAMVLPGLFAVIQLHAQKDAARSSVAQGASPIALRFDVVSIKLNRSRGGSESMESEQNSDSMTIRNMTLDWIIDNAYNFESWEQVSGLPEWAKTEKYDIAAKVADIDVNAFRKLTQEQRRTMLQAVLADAFKLKVHFESKEMPVYALVVGKNGPKVKLAVPGDTYANGLKFPSGTAAGADTLLPNGPGQFVGQGVSMAALAMMLTNLRVGRKVVDKTNLIGRYDFALQFNPTRTTSPPINGQLEALPVDEATAPSVFTAVQEQLGLKLVPTTGRAEWLIVDYVERPLVN
jgi:uncharacterized protein (TIGR03435 family)